MILLRPALHSELWNWASREFSFVSSEVALLSSDVEFVAEDDDLVSSDPSSLSFCRNFDIDCNFSGIGVF